MNNSSIKRSIPIYLLVIMFIFSKIFMPEFHNTKLFTNVINPLFWIFTAIIAYFCSRMQSEKRKRAKYEIEQSVLIILIIYVMVYFSLGLITGYQKSPYSHEFGPIIQNLWVFWVYIIFQEYIRAALLKTSPKGIVPKVIITILFIAAEMDFKLLSSSMNSNANFFQYISETLIPLIVTNYLFTYLIVCSSVKNSIIYRSIMTLMALLLPIYPNLNWLLASMIEIVLVMIISLYTNYIILKYSRDYTKREVKKEKLSSYIPYIVVLVLVVCFITGVFKYMPIAVLSNSMHPKFSRGDATVIEKIDSEYLQYLKKGDIIYYSKVDRMVMHRIVSITENSKGEINIITKGDNNITEDPWVVEEEDIKGIVRFMIPYIGYPAVLINDLLK